MDVSVIVPVLGDGPDLDRCVESLLKQDAHDLRWEVVVVDNGSEPPVAARWGPAARVLREPSPGSYAARNAGLDVAKGDVVAFTDADCEAVEDWLRAGLRAVAANPGSIVAGRVQLVTRDRPSTAELYERRYAFPQDRYLEEGFGVTANLFVPSSVFERIGRFDASLRSGGDREFGQRARAAGIATVFASDAIVRHPARATVGALVAKARRTAAGTVDLERRHSGTGAAVRGTMTLLRPPVRGLYRVLRSEPAPLFQRARLAGLVELLRLVTAAERLRVLLGGTGSRG